MAVLQVDRAKRHEVNFSIAQSSSKRPLQSPHYFRSGSSSITPVVANGNMKTVIDTRERRMAEGPIYIEILNPAKGT